MEFVKDDFIVEENIIKCISDIPIENGLGYEIFRCMKIFKNNIAQFIDEEEEEDTYDALFERSVRCALKMSEKGLEKGDIISICSYNHKNTCVPLIAALFLGIKTASLDPSLSINDTAYLLKQVTPKIIFFSSNATHLLEEALVVANLSIDLVSFEQGSEKYEQFSEYLQPNTQEHDFVPYNVESLNETAMVFYSSGTTGLAKGICLSHAGLLANAYNLRDYGYITSVTLSYTTMYWISSAIILFGCIMSGTCKVVCKSFDASKTWQLLEKYKVSWLFLSPSQGIQMIKAGRPEGLDTTNLLSILFGGSVMPTVYMLQARDLFPGTFVSQAYGQTECSGIGTCYKMNSPKDSILLHRKPDSCGRPMLGFWYKILDVNTEEILGPNQKGELRIKSQCQFNGYYSRDSSEGFDNDGWIKTGDILYYDEDYCFYFVERLKQLIKYRGDHVQPALLENILQEHPAVKVAIVIGLPHEEDGEHPLAVVQLNEGFEDADANGIKDFVDQKVHNSQKLRGGIKFVNNFPMTPSGKVKRLELKKLIIENRL